MIPVNEDEILVLLAAYPDRNTAAIDREYLEGAGVKSFFYVLRRYRDMPAAFVERSALENAGIQCFLQDDNVVRMDWLWSNALGGNCSYERKTHRMRRRYRTLPLKTATEPALES
jgi:hypothetical protein